MSILKLYLLFFYMQTKYTYTVRWATLYKTSLLWIINSENPTWLIVPTWYNRIHTCIPTFYTTCLLTIRSVFGFSLNSIMAMYCTTSVRSFGDIYLSVKQTQFIYLPPKNPFKIKSIVKWSIFIHGEKIILKM